MLTKSPLLIYPQLHNQFTTTFITLCIEKVVVIDSILLVYHLLVLLIKVIKRCNTFSQ